MDIYYNKKYVIIAHVGIILTVLGTSEPFDSAIFALWVMIIGLGLFLTYYFIFNLIKLKYIPIFDILIAFFNILIWIVLLATCYYWSNITGWDGIVYVIYPFIIGIFFICLLIMNLVVYIIKLVQRKKMQI